MMRRSTLFERVQHTFSVSVSTGHFKTTQESAHCGGVGSARPVWEDEGYGRWCACHSCGEHVRHCSHSKRHGALLLCI